MTERNERAILLTLFSMCNCDRVIDMLKIRRSGGTRDLSSGLKV
jgi:hypothetical protein